MPAHTAVRLSAYSSEPTCGKATGAFAGAFFLVRGKSSHRLRDLLRVGHEEILLRGVERHRRDVGSGDAHDRPIQAVESMLRDDRRNFGSEAAGEVVFVHHNRLARLPPRFEDGVAAPGAKAPEADTHH